jgi:Flp pilus assembly protein TadG
VRPRTHKPQQLESSAISQWRGALALALTVRFKAATAKSLGEKGAALVEFGLLAPVLVLILLGTAQFGLTLNQFVVLTNAVSIGRLQFALSRSDTQPVTDALSAITGAASTLMAASMTVTLSVNGTQCFSGMASAPTAAGNAACFNARSAAVGQPAAVVTTHSCNLHVMPYNFADIQPLQCCILLKPTTILT